MVVMETNMAWMGNIWQANPRKEAQKMQWLWRDVASCPAGVKAHTVTTQPHSCSSAVQKARLLFPIQIQPKWHSHGTATSPSREMHNLVSTTGGSSRRNNLPARRPATYHINHIAFTASSQSLSDTEIHPAALDKTSYHRAGDQLEVYVSIYQLLIWNRTNHSLCVFLL